jgi:hypothetical protein
MAEGLSPVTFLSFPFVFNGAGPTGEKPSLILCEWKGFTAFLVSVTRLLVAKMKSPVRFRQREATRAVRAAEDAGLYVHSLECCPDGRIIVHTTKEPQEPQARRDKG